MNGFWFPSEPALARDRVTEIAAEQGIVSFPHPLQGFQVTVLIPEKGYFPMSISSLPPSPASRSFEPGRLPTNSRRNFSVQPLSYHVPSQAVDRDAPNRHAEVFYLQKQIQSQTPMVIVLEDGERIDGCIEWYDRYSLKVRGRSRTLVYKSAIKYMYKLGDNG